ncbi:hypothetical protein FOL47_000432 [Perkinsus chesapeaki]|uniref:subtilisin n=1 Tax=Perkinsus chesapeaki TaxID=330153 RepID=A0A7J6MMF2_PERCH|nr:hypothetical protein FOL47_000432 [Perkinsus chesapeaki]
MYRIIEAPSWDKGDAVKPGVIVRQAEGSVAGKANDLPVNDPLYSQQRPYLKLAGVPAAWERMASATVARRKVTVALIDSGVERDHPDLVGNVVPGYNVIKKTTDTSDKSGHGTMMAGVVGATINNSIGIASVADLVNIMPISLEKHFDEKAEADSIDYAIRHKDAMNIKVILMPISGLVLRMKVEEKIQEAVAAGILVIVTAGNDAENITRARRYPCSLTRRVPGMLCVAATDSTDMTLAAFSNYGNYVDIAAPGKSIKTTLLSQPYGEFSGTSAASAIVAGVAAILFSINSNLSPIEAKELLKDTSKKGIKLFPGIPLEFGLVYADAAVAKLL